MENVISRKLLSLIHSNVLLYYTALEHFRFSNLISLECRGYIPHKIAK